MIIFPKDWDKVGKKINLVDIETTLLQILNGVDCSNLSFSGGIDSSLLLYYLLKLKRSIKTFTVGIGNNHPDIYYATIARVHLEEVFQTKVEYETIILPEKFTGDIAVAKYYKVLSHKITSIIAGDGIDEFMAGYYDHQKLPNNKMYYGYLQRLQNEQLEPLNKNSDKVKVYLPYIDERLIYLMSQIPIEEKVDLYKRKKIMTRLAQGKLPQMIIERKKYGFCTEG